MRAHVRNKGPLHGKRGAGLEIPDSLLCSAERARILHPLAQSEPNPTMLSRVQDRVVSPAEGPIPSHSTRLLGGEAELLATGRLVARCPNLLAVGYQVTYHLLLYK